MVAGLRFKRHNRRSRKNHQHRNGGNTGAGVESAGPDTCRQRSFRFNGRSTLSLGNKYFIAETCEYRRHFLAFHPRRILLSSVESDHQDYFPDYNSIRDAFVEYCRLLPPEGQLIYCADDPGASEVTSIVQSEGKKIEFIPYGFTADGFFGVSNYRVRDGSASFSLAAFPGDFTLRVPGRHQALNAAGALALCSVLLRDECGQTFLPGCGPEGWDEQRLVAAQKALENFRGSKRRSEIVGEAGGVLFMDDYGHHPTAISATLEGLKAFYPGRRLIVSFMSHTYTRTAALLDRFAHCFADADILFLHEIYSSAREHYEGGVNGKTLYDEVLKLRVNKPDSLYYIDRPMDAAAPLREILRNGDLFITMGAGNNWPLGLALYNSFRENVS